MWIHMRSDFIDDAQKIGNRHVWKSRRNATIASTVSASHITAQRAFPEKRLQLMQLDSVLMYLPEDFQAKPFA